MTLSKQKRWRSQRYIDWIKEQDCVMCGLPADDPHHLKGIGNMSGGSLTAPDWACMPMCRQCHTKIHAYPELWEQQWEWITRTLGKAISEGILK